MGYDLTNSRTYQEFQAKFNTDNREELLSLLSELTQSIMELENKISYIEMQLEDASPEVDESWLDGKRHKKRTLRWLSNVKKNQVVLVQQKIAAIKLIQKQENIKRESARHQSFLQAFFKVAKSNLKEETFQTLVDWANAEENKPLE
jgi:hypothetical protein